jgi:hypothetical protein
VGRVTLWVASAHSIVSGPSIRRERKAALRTTGPRATVKAISARPYGSTAARMMKGAPTRSTRRPSKLTYTLELMSVHVQIVLTAERLTRQLAMKASVKRPIINESAINSVQDAVRPAEQNKDARSGGSRALAAHGQESS